MITKKRCGSCTYYIKWKNNNNKQSGLCDLLDARTNSGNICTNWKGIKYKRPQKTYCLD